MIEQIITKGEMTFNELEQEIYRKLCQVGCTVIQEILEKIDVQIMQQRDHKIYSNLGLKKTHIDTIMGRVHFCRREYEHTDEKGIRKYVFLLDREIKIFGEGKFSAALIEIMATQLTVEAFRPAAAGISKMTGISVSHGTVWNMTQRIGGKIEEIEEQNTKLCKAGQITGTKEVDVIFEEADGVYLKLQGNDRKGHPRGKELKVGVVYEGWRKEGKNRHLLVNKKFCSTFGTSKEFKELKEGMIAANYNTDEIKMRLQNGDGADWIHDSDDEQIVSQLDPFHVKKALRRSIRDKENQKTVETLLKEKNIPLALEVIDALKNGSESEKEEKRLNDLYTYFSNNRDILIPYRERGLNLIKLPEGLEYRGMGTMEHQICDVITHRMKKRKGSWCIKSGSNMARILCAKMSNTLYDIIRKKMTPILPETYQAIVYEVLSAGKVPQRVGKGSDGNIRHGGMPFKGAAVTNGRKAIQGLLEINFSYTF